MGWSHYARRRRFPLNGQARSFRHAFGWIALIDVITFKKDFRPSGFDRPVTEYFKNQIVSKLAGAGIVRLTVLLKRGPARQLVLHFDGAPEDVAKANEAFDLEFSQRSRADTRGRRIDRIERPRKIKRSN
jgi:hypothetical protein